MDRLDLGSTILRSLKQENKLLPLVGVFLDLSKEKLKKYQTIQDLPITTSNMIAYLGR
jgi:hypothetical protein